MEYKNLTNIKTLPESFQSSSEKIDSCLLDNHIHFINGELDENSTKEAIKWLVYENLEKNKEKILTLYINSCGGSLTDTFGLIDVMRGSNYVIRTIGIGNVMSSAFILFSCGTKGERYIAKNTSIMCHQFAESMDNIKYHDVKAQMKETENCNNRMVEILKETTGLPTNKIKSKLLPPSDIYLTAEELIEFNVADHIL
jgi:ATP-dependent Clp protease protease subunit